MKRIEDFIAEDAVVITADAPSGADAAARRFGAPDAAGGGAFLGSQDRPNGETALDTVWPQASNQLIALLEIVQSGREFDILLGARRLLRRSQIDFVRFDYDRARQGPEMSLEVVCAYLKRFDYDIYLASGEALRRIDDWPSKALKAGAQRIVAAHVRFRTQLSGEDPEFPIFFLDLPKYGLKARGVIHVGAHFGGEVNKYRKNGLKKLVLIEANPRLAKRLHEKHGSKSGVRIVECAVSDQEGLAQFNIASMDQASSLLDFKAHAEMYPTITYTETVEVRTRRLDDIVAEEGVDLRDHNVISMDIQGAELMALRGAEETLKHIDALQVEASFVELYDGAPLLFDLDRFLEPRGFTRVKTLTPAGQWGDALYIRRPEIRYDLLEKTGRFGNQVFQYAYTRAYAQIHDYAFRRNPWVGEQFFKLDEPADATAPPFTRIIEEVAQDKQELVECDIALRPDATPSRALCGHFQYHSRFYRAFESDFRRWFALTDETRRRLEPLFAFFADDADVKAAIHVRRGDYGYYYFFLTPAEWIETWLQSLEAELGRAPVVFLASDDPDAVQKDLPDRRFVTLKDFGLDTGDAPYFADFVALMLARKVAISNSSFSFSAAMLNQNADAFVRPDLAAGGFTPFDPWNAEVLLRRFRGEEFGAQFVRDRSQIRFKHKVRWFRKYVLGLRK